MSGDSGFSGIQVSVVVPVYNASRFLTELLDIVSQFSLSQSDYEFVFVDDGSSDGSSQTLAAWIQSTNAARCQLLQLTDNHGKGHAITRGFELCRGQYICFLDCDLSYPLQYIPQFVQATQSADVVIACRDLEPLNHENISLLRKILGKTFNILSRLLTGLPYRDMQAGLKCFTHEAAREIFSRVTLRRFSFDVEVLYIASQLNYTVKQIPALVHDGLNKNNTSVNLVLDSLKMFRDLFWIRWCDLCGRYR